MAGLAGLAARRRELDQEGARHTVQEALASDGRIVEAEAGNCTVLAGAHRIAEEEARRTAAGDRLAEEDSDHPEEGTAQAEDLEGEGSVPGVADPEVADSNRPAVEEGDTGRPEEGNGPVAAGDNGPAEAAGIGLVEEDIAVGRSLEAAALRRVNTATNKT